MPEALVTVPPLQIPSENTSEMENSSTATEATDRSANSRYGNRNTAVIEKKSQSKHKIRKSNGRRFSKKPQLRPLISEKKSTGTLRVKSLIPRALVLTPSTSTNSLTTNDSLPSPLIPVVKPLVDNKSPESSNSSKSCLARQQSSLIIAFRERKSYSQMDFNHARRQVNFPMPSPTPLSRQTKDNYQYNKALILSHCNGNLALAQPKNSFVHKMYNQDHYFNMPARDPQMAGMRIFATIMLNAWRKRRDEVRRLVNEVAELKRTAIKAKNQLHVFNSLFRVEQKRNDELNFQLKRSLENVNITKSSCESLTTSLISLKADKALLEQQLQTKEQEFDSINILLNQTKSDLFKNMTLQRELQASLSAEQRKIQTLENQKNELINEICELNNEAIQKEDKLRDKIKQISHDSSLLKQKLNEKEQQLKTLDQSREQQLNDSKTREEQLKEQIEALENELKMTRKCLEETLGNRVKNFWNNSLEYQKITLETLHWLGFYILPATPPPKIKALPFGLSLNKALSIIKR